MSSTRLGYKDVSLAVRLYLHDPLKISLINDRSYRNLSSRTRLFVGGGIMAYAVFGLMLSDKAEEAFGLTPSEKDKQDLREAVPKIHLVERDKK